MTKPNAYQQAGVNIDAGNEAAKRYARIAKATARQGVLGGIGGFAGGFELDLQKYPHPVLTSGTDGVGTKLKIAFVTGRHNTIGIDCVAMCVNDVLTTGSEPLFFLDYLAVGRLEVDVAETIVQGIADGCEQAGCALIGGETAEMPGMYPDGEYDVAGTVVGVVDKTRMVDGSKLAAGDVVLGLASNGVHSNGFSLIRKIIAEAGLTLQDTVDGWRGTVADELLQPTRIYVKSILQLLDAGVDIRGMAHITGGGLVENAPRCLPDHLDVEITQGSWEIPAVFRWLQEQGNLTFEEANRYWNMGIGYVVMVPESEAAQAVRLLEDSGETVYRIGQVVEGQGAFRWS